MMSGVVDLMRDLCGALSADSEDSDAFLRAPSLSELCAVALLAALLLVASNVKGAKSSWLACRAAKRTVVRPREQREEEGDEKEGEEEEEEEEVLENQRQAARILAEHERDVLQFTVHQLRGKKAAQERLLKRQQEMLSRARASAPSSSPAPPPPQEPRAKKQAEDTKVMFPVRGEDRTRHSPFQSRGGKRSAGPPAPPQPSFAGTSFTDWTAVGTPGVYKNSSVPQSKEEAKRQASPFAVEGEPEGQESPAAAASGSEEVGGNGGQQGSQGETDQEEKQEQQQDETEAAEASGPWPHVVEDHF